MAFRSEVIIPFTAWCQPRSWDTVILSYFPRSGRTWKLLDYGQQLGWKVCLGNRYPEWGTEDEGQVAGEHTVCMLWWASQLPLQWKSLLPRPLTVHLADWPSAVSPSVSAPCPGSHSSHKVHIQWLIDWSVKECKDLAVSAHAGQPWWASLWRWTMAWNCRWACTAARLLLLLVSCPPFPKCWTQGHSNKTPALIL